MNEQIIGILPFISFKEIIHIDDFLIFSDSKVQEITELSESIKKLLNDISQNQKSFMEGTYGNKDIRNTFILTKKSTVTTTDFEKFVDVIMFYLHKGGKERHVLSAPNAFCREDFRLFVFQRLGADSSGQFIAKKKFKFHIMDDVTNYIILPSGCENVVTQKQQSWCNFRDVEFDYRDVTFQYLVQVFQDDQKQNILQAISFYNKALSCDQSDSERYLWISSSLEAFFKIGKQNDKKKAIKKATQDLLQRKEFQVIDKDEAIEKVADLITLLYDYRSSYIHGGEAKTDCISIEEALESALGKLDFVIGIMNLVSVIVLNEILPDNRIEAVIHLIFHNQDCFEQVTKVFKESASTAISKLQKFDMTSAIHRFALIGDLQTISFNRAVVERCLNNILYVFAQFTRKNPEHQLAIKIQKHINSVDFNDREKFKKWNSFLEVIDVFMLPIIPSVPDYIFSSALVFMQLFRLFEYEYVIY